MFFKKATLSYNSVFFACFFFLFPKGTSSAIKVNITCDSYLEFYVDGKHLGGGATNARKEGFLAFEITAGSQMIALSCKGSAGPWEGGILGSFDNGLVTDSTWKCITSPGLGWNTRTYQDHDWPMALSYGPNNDSTLPWGEISSIDEKAVWIWSKDNKQDTKVYCRRNLVEPCTKGGSIVHLSARFSYYSGVSVYICLFSWTKYTDHCKL